MSQEKESINSDATECPQIYRKSVLQLLKYLL